MAVQKTVKKEEPKEEKRRPDFVARARQAKESEYFSTIGAAWKTEIAGQEGVSVKLNLTPLDWDGSFLLMVPKERDE